MCASYLPYMELWRRGYFCEAVSLGYVETIAREREELEGLLESGVGRVVRGWRNGGELCQ